MSEPIDRTSDPISPATAPRDWFILFLRVLGFWELIQTADEVITILNIHFGIWRPERTAIQSYFTHGMVHLLITVWLLMGAPKIARIFYGDRSGRQK